MDALPPEELVLDAAFARHLTEITESLVCVLGADGRILHFNDACVRATGFAREEVLGQRAQDCVIPPEEAHAFDEMLAYLWQTGISTPRVGHWMTRDGTRRLISWSNRLVAGPGGQGGYLLTSGVDLTRRAPTDGHTEPVDDELAARLVELERLAQEQRSLRRVATLVASEASPERVFMAVSEECATVLDVNTSAVVRYEDDRSATIVGRHSRSPRDAFVVGDRLPAEAGGSIDLVLSTGAPARVDDWPSQAGDFARTLTRFGHRSTASAPIVVGGALWGAVSIASDRVLPTGSETRLGAFGGLVSLAVASAQARSDLEASRARVLRAADQQRRRLERNLHDGAQQRLVSLALMLRRAQVELHANAGAVPELLNDARHELDAALEELREIARGLHPGSLTGHGLRHALQALATRLPLPVEVEAPEGRLPDDVEATAYYIVAESLTNVIRHARATRATVEVRLDGNALRLAVTDDGGGGADPARGTGLVGLRDRAEVTGGTLEVAEGPDGGTVVRATLPVP